MKKNTSIELDFKVDKLTNSIENVISGEVFETVITQISQIKQVKKSDWLFDWHTQIEDQSKLVFAVSTTNNPLIIQGLICITDKKDHIFMDLIENAKFNKGRKKLYRGVAGNLVAFACKTSFEKGYNGVVSFIAKTQLIEHYSEILGAKLFSKNRMFIDTKEAQFLTKKYFKTFKPWQ
ncbi:MAG TPA: hypothetical protein DDZ41_05200 [Flavobacterium sp.]|nr:hypothetical protein [Flavobacterium sp.]